ncbi:MAG: phosphoribosylglycinamide formyltransferase [Candidatus Magasanikbacteria bacterium]|nr:phosphoribosylglycinamide formyltransferase [Candidatus Magasanikbacteria bacterium]
MQSEKKLKIGVLGSTRGTSMQPIIDAIEQNLLKASVELVVSNVENAFILKRARMCGIAATYINDFGKNREDYDKEVSKIFESFEVDLVLLIGYMKILSQFFVQKWAGKIMNVHPSLLPAFTGKMDEQVHYDVLVSGDKESGCTIHFVDEGVDSGDIIIQKKCSVLSHDTVISLKDKVQKLEGKAFIEAIKEFANGSILSYNSEVQDQIQNRSVEMCGKTALLSVYNKTDIDIFARKLIYLGWKIVASGGTARFLKERGIEVQDVADFVGGGAILGHRVVTLDRKIHAALLSKDLPEDNEELKRLGVPKIDLVCVDLYPLEDEISSEGSTQESVIEKTDIGGPTLLRSAAKGRRIVVCDFEDRDKTLKWLAMGKPYENKFITNLVAKTEEIVARYCLISANFHSEGKIKGIVGFERQKCGYGENAQQKTASLLTYKNNDPLSFNNFKQVRGVPMSYNNCCDVDRMVQTITHIAAGFDINFGEVPFIAVAVKHGNPCGVAIGEDKKIVLQRVIDGDPRAIFGGMIMTNFSLGVNDTEVILNYKMEKGGNRLLDGVVAPAIDENTRDLLKRRTGRCRMVENPALAEMYSGSLDKNPRFRYVRGGFLLQDNYDFVMNFTNTVIEKQGIISEDIEKDLILAWAIGSTSNSNAITLVKNRMLIGNGVGQQDRVGACELAIKKATDQGHLIVDSVAYSDSFFPFLDGPEKLYESRVKAILTSSGSVRDKDLKDFCLVNGITLYMIPDKIGRGFFGH